jgi:asparagine synthase (glutamine-hydrolysing)
MEWIPSSGCRPGVTLTHWHEEADIAIAIHGEILNADELCLATGQPKGIALGPLIATGWRLWAEGLLPRLDGVFALVLGLGDSVLLYRDPSALSSLYCCTADDGRFWFAAHLDALMRQPREGRDISRRSLHEYLRFLDIAAPNTMFKDVVAVEPGRALRWHWPRRLEAVGTLTAPRDTPPPAAFDEAVETLEGILRLGVNARLAGAAHPAAFLSGGIDSALICALAAKDRGDIAAVTVGFSGASFDEAPIAVRVAKHLGIAHQVLRFDQMDFVAAFDRLVRTLEQPMADPAMLATVLAFEHCASRFDVVLDGTGADEAVGAMPARHVRLAVEYASLLPTGARLALARMLKGLPGLAGYTPILDFKHPADTMIRWQGFTQTEIEALCGEPVSFEHTQFYRTFNRFKRQAHEERYRALMSVMPADRLIQASRATGLRPRYPFAELHTERFLRQLPTDFRHLPNEPKRILRALLARYVPRPIWDVPKRGFDFPLAEFLAADGHALVRRYLDRERWRRTGLLAPDLVEDYGRRFIAGDRRLRFRVWALVVLAAWLEHHPAGIPPLSDALNHQPTP